MVIMVVVVVVVVVVVIVKTFVCQTDYRLLITIVLAVVSSSEPHAPSPMPCAFYSFHSGITETQ